MSDENRGKIYNKKRAEQIRNFSGLKFDKITPTDIDAFIDFRNRLFIIVETKLKGTELPFGQQLAIERLCDACQKSGIPTYAIVTSHETNAEEEIDFAKTSVIKYRYKGKWKDPKSYLNLREAIDKLKIKHLDCF